MASHPDLPDEYKPYLKPAKEMNAFDISDWAKWLERPRAKMGKVLVFSSHEQRYETRIAGIKRGRMGDEWLFLEQFEPDPPEEFFVNKPAIVVRSAFVEHGYVVGTSFPAKPKGPATIDKVGGVLVDDVFRPRAVLKPHIMPLPSDTASTADLVLKGKTETLKLAAIGINRVRLHGTLDFTVGSDGVSINKMILRLKEGESRTITVKALMKSIEYNRHEAVFTFIEEEDIEFLQRWVDEQWSAKVEKQERRRADAKRREHEASTGEYLKHLHKTHFFLLSDNERWGKMLGELGVVRHLADKDLAYLREELQEERCDFLLADADHWGARALEIAEMLHNSKEFGDFPVFWLSSDAKFAQTEAGRKLLELGAYDILSRMMVKQSFVPVLKWTLKDKQLGATGNSMIVISPNQRQQYRLGMELKRHGMKIIKAVTREQPLSHLNEHLPRWILVDAVGIGSGYDMILNPCLSWATKSSKKRDVFLMTAEIDQEAAIQWMTKGLTDIILYDPVTTKPMDRLQEHVKMALHQRS